MVIWSEFGMGQDRDDNHRVDAPHFTKSIVLLLSVLKRINSKGGIIPDVILVGDILESLSQMINNPNIESEVVSKTEELGVTIVNFIIGHWKALDKCIFAIFPALSFSLTTVLTKNDNPMENELLYKLLELTRHGKVDES